MTIRHGARVGAAAFALGLALAGPQVAGSALADGGASEGPAVSSDSGDARGGAVKPGRSAGQARPVRVVEREAAAPARRGAPARSAGRPDARAANDAPGKGVGEPAAARSEAVRRVRVEQAVPGAAAAVSVIPDRPVVRSAAVSVAPVGAAAQVTCVCDAAPAPVGAAASLEALNTAIVGWFDSARRLLAILPGGPLTDLLSGALLLVRRTLFNQLPTASPAQLFTNTVGQISGSIGATDLEGDPLTYRLVDLPQFGAVQISADGEYIYSPGPDFTGSDAFTVAVSDNGFNLLDSTSDRVTLVTMQVPDDSLGPLVGATRGFNIQNLSGQAVQLVEIRKESGYESAVDAKPAGTVVRIGETYHVELTSYAFYEYDTRFIFKPCADINCAGGELINSPWNVYIASGVIGFGGNYSARCDQGRCVNDKDQSIDFYNRYSDAYEATGLNSFGNSSVILVDRPGTVRTVGGDQAQTQAAVIATVCSAVGSTCSFISNGPLTPTTIGKTKIFNNRSNEPQNINQSYSETVTATSSTKYTYQQSSSYSIGVKDSWGLAFTAAFGQELSSSNSLATTTTVTINQVLPAFTRGISTFGAPADRVTGTYTAWIKNTKFTLKDVWFDFPRLNSDVASYDWSTEPLSNLGRFPYAQ